MSTSVGFAADGRPVDRIDSVIASRHGAVLFDRLTGMRCVVASPADQPQLWRAYANGVRDAYRSWGVDDAFDYDAVIDGRTTAVFCAVIDAAGEVVAGHRVQGPYIAAAQSHALVEWSGQAGQRDLVDAIETRLSSGLIEIKSAYVVPKGRLGNDLADLLSRLTLTLMELTDSRYIMATAAEHVLGRWSSGGGRVDSSVPPTPYPDERYATRVMFWDRESMELDVDPELWLLMLEDYRSVFGADALLDARAA